MANPKAPSEGGSGGKRGHSGMEHWGYTDEVKEAARIRRRHDARATEREGMVEAASQRSVFLVQHSYERSECGCEEVKLIGAYSTRAQAEAAIERLQAESGFAEHPDGFAIDEYELDQGHWLEGFVSA